MQNRKLIWSSLIVALMVAGLAAFMVLPSAEELLVTAGETLENVADAHAVITVEAEMPEESGSGTVAVWGQKAVGPNGEPAFRVEVLEASKEEMVGLTAVSDGTQFWLYQPQENKVFTGTIAAMKAKMEAQRTAKEASGDHAPTDWESFGAGQMPFGNGEFNPDMMPQNWEEAVAKLLEYFTAERTGSEDVGNLAAYRLRLLPLPEQMPDEIRANGGYINLWLGVDSQVPIGVEYAEGAIGYAKATASVMNLNQGIDPAIFTFEIPDGAELINVEDWEPPAEHKRSAQTGAEVAPTTLLSPTSLPNAARPGESFTLRGVAVQQFELGNGRSFTVAQGQPSDAFLPSETGAATTVRGVAGTLYQDEANGRSLLTWVENGTQFWVGGDIGADQALTVAESLQ